MSQFLEHDYAHKERARELAELAELDWLTLDEQRRDGLRALAASLEAELDELRDAGLYDDEGV
jgi:hypothetical protein